MRQVSLSTLLSLKAYYKTQTGSKSKTDNCLKSCCCFVYLQPKDYSFSIKVSRVSHTFLGLNFFEKFCLLQMLLQIERSFRETVANRATNRLENSILVGIKWRKWLLYLRSRTAFSYFCTLRLATCPITLLSTMYITYCHK